MKNVGERSRRLYEHIYGPQASREARREVQVTIARAVDECEDLLEEWTVSRYADHSEQGQWKKILVNGLTWPW